MSKKKTHFTGETRIKKEKEKKADTGKLGIWQMFAHEGWIAQPPPPSAKEPVSIGRIQKTRTQPRPLGKLGKGAVGKLLTSPEHLVTPTLAMQAPIAAHTPRTARLPGSRCPGDRTNASRTPRQGARQDGGMGEARFINP